MAPRWRARPLGVREQRPKAVRLRPSAGKVTLLANSPVASLKAQRAEPRPPSKGRRLPSETRRRLQEAMELVMAFPDAPLPKLPTRCAAAAAPLTFPGPPIGGRVVPTRPSGRKPSDVAAAPRLVRP